MDAKLQRRVQRYGWDRAAPYYEGGWQAQLAPAQAALIALADLAPGEQVLDVACGTGLVTFKAAALVGPRGHVLGADISEHMLIAARAVGDANGVGNVRFERMDAEDLTLADDTFDAALCALGLMYVPDPGQALRELCRVLKGGGRAVAAVWGRRGACGWADIFPIVDARVQSEVCPLFFRLGTGDALRQAFALAGFGAVTEQRLETRLRYADADAACEAAFAGGPVALAYSRFSDETRAAARADYLDSIARYREGEGYAIPGEFVVVAGVKPEQASHV